MVTLNKGQRLSLAKTGGGTLTRVRMGLGWDAAAPKQQPRKSGFWSRLLGHDEPSIASSASIDLDATCLMFAGKKLIDTVYFGQLRSKDGSVVHTGDNLTGDGDGDDESIIVDLSKVPSRVDALVFVVNSYSGQTFNEIDNAFCRLVDAALPSEPELARYELSGASDHLAVIMAKVVREGSGWSMTAIGERSYARRIMDLVPQAQEAL